MPSPRYAARRKIVAEEDGEEEDVVPESQELLPTARPEDFTYDAFVAANAKARGDAPPAKAAEARPEWWSPRGGDKTTPFSNKFDLSKPLRKMTRRGKTPPPAPIEAAANEKFSAVAERPREDEGRPARVDEPEPKSAAKKGLLRVKTSRDAVVAAAEPIAQVAPVVPLGKCVPDTAYKSAAPPAATPLGARLASGKKRREAPARNTRAKRAKTRAEEDVTPPKNPSKVVKRAARAEPEPEPELDRAPMVDAEDDAYGFLRDANEEDDADPHAMSDDDDDAFERGARQSREKLAEEDRARARAGAEARGGRRGGGFCGEAAATGGTGADGRTRRG